MRTFTTDFTGEQAARIRGIRNSVFSVEQKIDANLDFDGQDAAAVHALVETDGEYAGTGRILPDGHIGRLAVLKPFRGRSLGRELILKLIEEATKRGIKRVFLGAQEHAVGFYRKLGFSEYAEPYHEAGIRHIHMEKHI